MVVSKSKVEQMETDTLTGLFKEWERMIDAGLQRGIRSFSLDSVDYSLKDALFRTVKVEYEKVGWKVLRDTYDDFRGSWDCIKFS